VTYAEKDLKRWKRRIAFAADLAERGVRGEYEHSSWQAQNQFAAILAVLAGEERAKEVFLATNPAPQG
jgi:hypothetical protein